jgi:hypothetical protein
MLFVLSSPNIDSSFVLSKDAASTSSSEKSWLSKVRSWFLKVVLSNTFRAPLGTCASCEGVDLHSTIRAGARVCKVCSGMGTEVVDFTTESQPLPRPLKPRDPPNIREISEQGVKTRSPHEERESCTETVGDMVTEGTLTEDVWCEANTLRVTNPGQTVRNFRPMKEADDGEIGVVVPMEQTAAVGRVEDADQRHHQGTSQAPQMFWSGLESLNKDCDGPGGKVGSTALQQSQYPGLVPLLTRWQVKTNGRRKRGPGTGQLGKSVMLNINKSREWNGRISRRG